MRTWIFGRSTDSARVRSERGATATEYGLLVGFIAFAIILGVTTLGTEINTLFQDFGAVVGGW